jgi:hypothetical protein
MDELIGKFVKMRPKGGHSIYDPISLQKIPPEGALVLFSLYWVKMMITDQAERVADSPKPELATRTIVRKND